MLPMNPEGFDLVPILGMFRNSLSRVTAVAAFDLIKVLLEF